MIRGAGFTPARADSETCEQLESSEGAVEDSDEALDLLRGVVVHQTHSHHAVLDVATERLAQMVRVHVTVADGDPRTIDDLGDLA